jgi:anion-transporting  ArsA/GET3 family ATPase
MLRGPGTRFTLVTTAAEDRVHDALYFARRLQDAGMDLAEVVVNRLHPAAPRRGGDLARLAAAVTAREAVAVALLRRLLADGAGVTTLPMLAEEPTDVEALRGLFGALAIRQADQDAAPRKDR